MERNNNRPGHNDPFRNRIGRSRRKQTLLELPGGGRSLRRSRQRGGPRATGHRPIILPNLGASLPNDIFVDVLKLKTIWNPHSYAGCSQHAPDEHLLAPIVREGLDIMAGLFWDLGEPADAKLTQGSVGSRRLAWKIPLLPSLISTCANMAVENAGAAPGCRQHRCQPHGAAGSEPTPCREWHGDTVHGLDSLWRLLEVHCGS